MAEHLDDAEHRFILRGVIAVQLVGLQQSSSTISTSACGDSRSADHAAQTRSQTPGRRDVSDPRGAARCVVTCAPGRGRSRPFCLPFLSLCSPASARAAQHAARSKTDATYAMATACVRMRSRGFAKPSTMTRPHCLRSPERSSEIAFVPPFAYFFHYAGPTSVARR